MKPLAKIARGLFFMGKIMRKILILLVITCFLVQSTDLSYALRPMAYKITNNYEVSNFLSNGWGRNAYRDVKRSILLFSLAKITNGKLASHKGMGFVVGESKSEFLILAPDHLFRRRRRITKIEMCRLQELQKNDFLGGCLVSARIVKRSKKHRDKQGDLTLIAIKKDFFIGADLIQPLPIKAYKTNEISGKLRVLAWPYQHNGRKRVVWLTNKINGEISFLRGLLFLNIEGINGFSGAPVMNANGYVVGMVIGGIAGYPIEIAIPGYYITKFLNSANETKLTPVADSDLFLNASITQAFASSA